MDRRGAVLKRVSENTAAFTAGTICAAAALCLIIYSKSVAKGVARGLLLCAESIIPSLFAFIVISIFMCRSPAGKAVSLLFYPVTKYILRLKPELGCVVVMSMFGGYPVGAGLISDMVRSGELSKKTASYMMWFCSNAGPAFVITAVGINMFGSVSAGVILLVSHLASSLILGVAAGVFSDSYSFEKDAVSKSDSEKNKKSMGDIFVESVSAGVNSIFAICAYVVLFSALLSVLEDSSYVNSLSSAIAGIFNIDRKSVVGIMNGFFEVTTACSTINGLGLNNPIPIAAFFISFSGISVILQVRHSFSSTGVKLRGYIVSRFVSGVLSAVIAFVLLRLFPEVVSAGGVFNNPVAS